MKKNAVYILFLIITFTLGATQAQESEAKNTDLTAADQIEELHGGILLVRLPTKQNSIDALIKTGRSEQAEQVRKQNEEKNLDLIKAMQAKFTFCPVYFFYSYDSEHILNGNLDSVTFLAPDLTADPSIKIGDQPFYTAEVTLVSQDTSNKQKNLRSGEEDDRDNQNEAKYYGGANMRFQALIIKDAEFNQLRRPFPYYSRTLNSFFIKKSLSDVVETMDQKLWRFYGK
jgi:hypothetical protein